MLETQILGRPLRGDPDPRPFNQPMEGSPMLPASLLLADKAGELFLGSFLPSSPTTGRPIVDWDFKKNHPVFTSNHSFRPTLRVGGSMKSLRIFPAVALIGCLAFSHNISAAIDPAAAVVLLRTSCNDGAGGTLNNCFTSSDTLIDWVWNTRNPSATAPLLVEIGPGAFDTLGCAGKGFVTFRGAGRGQTIITGSAFGSAFTACNQLAFEHLTISGSSIGVAWSGGGSSSWTDVEILGSFAAWYDSGNSGGNGIPCPGREGTHKFFGSTLKATGTAGASSGGARAVFLNICGKNWLFGSEIVLDATTTGAPALGIRSRGTGNEVHLYGSNLRLFSGDGSALPSITAIQSVDGAEVHVHGTGIDVIASKPIDVTAITVGSGGVVHASESAYVLKTAAGGNKTRISNNGGHVYAPYLWPSDVTPPSITSQDGSDMAVVTVVGGTPTPPRFIVYSTACTSKWFDVGANTCHR